MYGTAVILFLNNWIDITIYFKFIQKFAHINFKKKYNDGEFVYAATGGGDERTSDFYGEALIPQKYIENNWTKRFTLCDFFYDTNRLPQAFFALKKNEQKYNT